MCVPQLTTLSFPQGSPGEATHKGDCALEVTDYDTEQGQGLVLLSCRAGSGAG